MRCGDECGVVFEWDGVDECGLEWEYLSVGFDGERVFVRIRVRGRNGGVIVYGCG